jgi:ATP-dependent DNA helicase RecQ
MVHYRPHREAAVHKKPRYSDDGLRAALAPDEQMTYDRLRTWRNGEGVPPFVLLTNRQLAELSRKRPATIAQLREVPGIGEAKAGRYGRDLLALLVPPASTPNTEASHAS